MHLRIQARRASRARLAVLALACSGPLALAFVPSAWGAPLEGIHKIQHVIVIMQENRSFDSYFGTYPGANGIPPDVCVPDPLSGDCVRPFHDPADKNYGGPHGHGAFEADLDGGKLDGFVGEAEHGSKCKSTEPTCSPCTEEGAAARCIDVMGYHDAREIPNYWTYAQNFVLQDNMYEPNSSWSWPEHLFQVSAWSAECKEWSNPLSCFSKLEGPPSPDASADPYTGEHAISLPWTDITFLLHKHSVSWGYYVFEGTEPDCESDEAMTCAPKKQGPKTPGIWNPLVDFMDVKEDGQLGNVQSLTNFYSAVQKPGECGLPNLAWVDPNGTVSEHPPALVTSGQAYVTTLINAIMRSPCWDSSAIFLSWDDWGGFYDHVVPAAIDGEGYGFRVPGLMISPYARAGYIDHQQLSHDAYLKFIEDDFLEGARLNPKADGRPDSRPDVREEVGSLGNLSSDFEFNQSPRAPLILPTHPAPGPASNPPGFTGPPPPVVTPPAPPASSPQPPAPSPASIATPLALQLSASVAPRQNARRQRRRIYLVVGCDEACSLYAHGHLNIARHRRHLHLRSVVTQLTAHHSIRIALLVPRNALTAVGRALRAHKHVEALIDVDVSAQGHSLRDYIVRVRLT